MTLGDYLQAQSRLSWRAGVRDCCTFPADWVRSQGRGDPMTQWRGLYRTDEEAACLIARAGGLVQLWNRGLGAIGAHPVAQAREGDVGVIVAVGAGLQPEQIGAVFTGRRWAFRAPAGLFFASAEVVKAWSCG